MYCVIVIAPTVDMFAFADAFHRRSAFALLYRVNRLTRDGRAIDKPMSSLTMGLVRAGRASVEHDDGVLASQRRGRVDGRQ